MKGLSTDSGIAEEDNEDTPVTSSNSETKYPHNVAGGSVGAPAPLSVRDNDSVVEQEGPEGSASSFEMVEERGDEFPPIKELELQESDSEEEESHFDDAVDNFKQSNQRGNEEAAFDDDIFNDLQPATEDVDENFNLEPAHVDNEDTTEFEKSDDANKDEWEQLFAGFGNS